MNRTIHFRINFATLIQLLESTKRTDGPVVDSTDVPVVDRTNAQATSGTVALATPSTVALDTCGTDVIRNLEFSQSSSGSYSKSYTKNSKNNFNPTGALRDECQNLGLNPELDRFINKENLATIKNQVGHNPEKIQELRDALRGWATAIKPTTRYPISDFLRYYLNVGKPDTTDLAHVLGTITLRTDKILALNNSQKPAVASCLGKYSAEEIVACAVDFVQTLTEGDIPYAGKNFAEKLEQLLFAQRAKQEREKAMMEGYERTLAREREELAKTPKITEIEDDMFKPVGGGFNVTSR